MSVQEVSLEAENLYAIKYWMSQMAYELNPGLHIRAGSRRFLLASLPGFAGYFHCFANQDFVVGMMFIRAKLLSLAQ